MSEWKELDINIIPSDFFVNENYQLEYWCTQKRQLAEINEPDSGYGYERVLDITGDWVKGTVEIEERIEYIHNLLNTDNKSKYRYKLLGANK